MSKIKKIYIGTYINDQKLLVIDADRGSAIIKLFKAFSTKSYSLNALVKYANKLKLRTNYNKRINKRILIKVITDIRYCDKVVVTNPDFTNYQKLVDIDTFNCCNFLLKNKNNCVLSLFNTI